MSEAQQTINPVHTSCRDCAFAEYDAKWRTQTGCGYENRIDLYRKAGVVLEAEDGDREFYVVNGRHCPAYAKADPANPAPLDELTRKTKERLQVKVDVVVPLTETVDPAGLRKFVQRLKATTKPYQSVRFVNVRSSLKAAELSALLREVGEGLNWYVTNVVDDATEEKAVERVLDALKGHFYLLINYWDVPRATIVERLTDEVVYKLSQTAVYAPTFGCPGLVVATNFHRRVSGNRPMDSHALSDKGPSVPLTKVQYKAAYVSEHEKVEGLLKNTDELCK